MATNRIKQRQRDSQYRSLVRRTVGDYTRWWQQGSRYVQPFSLPRRCWHTVYGTFTGTLFRIAYFPKVTKVVTVGAGLAAFGATSYLSSLYVLPWLATSAANNTLARRVISGIIGSVAGTALYKLTDLFIYPLGFWGMRQASALALRQMEKNPHFVAIQNKKSQDIATQFLCRQYDQVSFKKAKELLKVDDIQDMVAEYLHELIERHPKWSELDCQRQKELVANQLREELNALLRRQNQEETSSSLYKQLLERASSCLRSTRVSDDPARELALDIYTSVESVCLRDPLVKFDYSCMRDVESGIGPNALINLWLNSLIRHGLRQMSSVRKVKLLKADDKIVRLLNSVILEYLQKKISQPVLHSKPVNQSQPGEATKNPQSVTTSSASPTPSASSSQSTPPKRHKPQGQQPKPAKQTKARSLDKLELPNEAIDKLVKLAPERGQFIRKCCEYIQNCGHWDDLRMHAHRDQGWQAIDCRTGQALPVYHTSSGIRENGGQRKATLFFTRTGNRVEPIALAEHTGQGSAQYKILERLNGWNPPDQIHLLTKTLAAISRI